MYVCVLVHIPGYKATHCTFGGSLMSRPLWGHLFCPRSSLGMRLVWGLFCAAVL